MPERAKKLVTATVLLGLASFVTADDSGVPRSEEDSLLALKLYGELPIKSGSHVNSLAFKSDNRTFAMPIDDNIVGVYRIRPASKAIVVPLTAAQRRTVAERIADLDSDEFAKRERAVVDLLAFGVQIETPLRNAMKESDSTESRYRLRSLLKNIAKMKSPAPVDHVDQVVRFRGLDGDIRTVEFSPDDRKLLVAGEDRHMRMLDSSTYRETQADCC